MIEGIVVQIGNDKILLSRDEAIKLYHDLDELFGPKMQAPFTPPFIPPIPTRPWWEGTTYTWDANTRTLDSTAGRPF